MLVERAQASAVGMGEGWRRGWGRRVRGGALFTPLCKEAVLQALLLLEVGLSSVCSAESKHHMGLTWEASAPPLHMHCTSFPLG